MSKRTKFSTTFEPLAWLGTFAVSLFALAYIAPGLSVTIVLCGALSIALTLIATSNSNLQDNKSLPWIGAILSAFIVWVAVLLLPTSGQEAGVIERVIVVVSAAVILMPALLLVEMVTSVAFITMISKAQGKTNLGGELQVASLVDRKFGGLLGSINR